MSERKLDVIMIKKLKIVIPCSEANHVCDKSQYKESSFNEKIKLYIHLMYCGACRDYSNTNTRLSSIILKSKVTCIDKKYKDSMKNLFEKAMNNSDFK